MTDSRTDVQECPHHSSSNIYTSHTSRLTYQGASHLQVRDHLYYSEFGIGCKSSNKIQIYSDSSNNLVYTLFTTLLLLHHLLR